MRKMLQHTAADMRRVYRHHRPLAALMLVAVLVGVTGLGVMVHTHLNGDNASTMARDTVPDAASEASAEDDAEAQAQAQEEAFAAAQAEAAAISSAVEVQLDELFAGAEYAVKVVDLADRTVPVSINEDEIYASASTYKLYVAYSMLSALDAGTMTWDSALNGTTLQECFALMIGISDNECAQAWLDTVVSRDEMNAQAAAIGATSTRFAMDEVTVTTAADLATILTGVYDGTLMSESSNAALIDAMETQIYRDGIPAGIGDRGVVADKVGFLYGYLNDAGIVYSDKGDYAFVILTNNASWAAIAEATAIIYDALPE